MYMRDTQRYMKKIFLILAITILFHSCYVHKYSIGEGAQIGIEETRKQHNFLGGLISLKTPDVKEMANNNDDYQIESKHSFVDMLVSFLTSGLWNPTTIKVIR